MNSQIETIKPEPHLNLDMSKENMKNVSDTQTKALSRYKILKQICVCLLLCSLVSLLTLRSKAMSITKKRNLPYGHILLFMHHFNIMT